MDLVIRYYVVRDGDKVGRRTVKHVNNPDALEELLSTHIVYEVELVEGTKAEVEAYNHWNSCQSDFVDLYSALIEARR